MLPVDGLRGDRSYCRRPCRCWQFCHRRRSSPVCLNKIPSPSSLLDLIFASPCPLRHRDPLSLTSFLPWILSAPPSITDPPPPSLDLLASAIDLGFPLLVNVSMVVPIHALLPSLNALVYCSHNHHPPFDSTADPHHHRCIALKVVPMSLPSTVEVNLTPSNALMLAPPPPSCPFTVQQLFVLWSSFFSQLVLWSWLDPGLCLFYLR